MTAIKCSYGDGYPQTPAAAGATVGHPCRAGHRTRSSFLHAPERAAGSGAVRPVCRGRMRPVLRGQERTSVAAAGNLLPPAADWVFRGHRLGTGDRVASRRFVGLASVSAYRSGRGHTRSLNDLQNPETDRCGNTPETVPVGIGST